MKTHDMKLGLIESAIKNSEPFERVGADNRTQEKYFKLMDKYGYVVRTEKTDSFGEHLWIVPENIKDMKPQSLGDYIKQLEAKANGQPIPKQTTLEGQ